MLNCLISLLVFILSILDPWYPVIEEKFSKGQFFPFAFTTSELSFLLNPQWSLIVSLLGDSFILYNSCPWHFLAHSSFYFLIAFLVAWVFFADSIFFTQSAFAVIDKVSSSLTPSYLNFFNLQPVASFANLSAALLLQRPIWAGT